MFSDFPLQTGGMETSPAGMKVEVCVRSLRSKLGLEYQLYICETLDKSGELAAMGSVFMLVFVGMESKLHPKIRTLVGLKFSLPLLKLFLL